MPLTTYSPGDVLTASSLNANLVFAAANPPGGLTFISSTTIPTAVSTVTVSNAFSATYERYKVVLAGGVASTTININLLIGSATANYNAFGYFGFFNGASVGGSNLNNGASFTGFANGTANTLNVEFEIQDPFLAKNTIVNARSVRALASTGLVSNNDGVLIDTTSHTSFTIVPVGGTITGGTIKVYGYAIS